MGGAILFTFPIASGPTNGFFWALLGNAATVDGVNFLGTTDNIPLSFRVNNVKAGRIDNTKRNAFFGYQSGLAAPSGVDNTFFGNAAGKATTSGFGNVFMGSDAGLANTIGFWNVFIGFNAASAYVGSGLNYQNNVGIGANVFTALLTGNDNTGIGASALQNQTGGSHNTALGSGAGNGITTGQTNTFFGSTSGVTVGTENGSIALGYTATITASNELVAGGNGAHLTRLRFIYSGAGATHSEFFRTSTPEGAQTAVRGDMCYVDDGVDGKIFYKATGTGNTGWLQLASGVIAATQALDNLAAVSINTSLLAQTGVDLGSAANAFRDLYLFGTGTYGSTSLKFTGVPTANRFVTFPDNTGTVAELNLAQTWTLKQTLSSNLIMSALIEKYNGINTVSNGIASMIASSDLTVQGAAIGATTLYAVPASGVGFYRVSWSAMVSRVATTSCSLGGATGFQLQYTDADDSVVKLSNPTTPEVSAINATGTQISGSFCCYCKASTNLQFLFGYTSVGVQSMQYSLHIKVEVLG